ncbi:MAG: Fructoselysine 6-kinase [Anaerolineae bacterium]|nr:Fructoselysine 6-kinase [Anaerolineae bacterium]
MSNVLLGVVCLDIYTRTGNVRPGCGILHNAWHLQQLGSQPRLITRIGRDHSSVFFDFFHRNQIAVLSDCLAPSGRSASIQIDVQPSGEALITNFEPGVWADFRLTPAEEAVLAGAQNLHLVLARGVAPEFVRLATDGQLAGVQVSADFLSFRDFTVDSFANLLQHIHLAFIGWKGELADPMLAGIRAVARELGRAVVITLGERGVQLFNGPTAEFFPVEKVAVQANTNGCGDAFIAYFLHRYWRGSSLAQAVAYGQIGGAAATRWQYALPESAYGE